MKDDRRSRKIQERRRKKNQEESKNDANFVSVLSKILVSPSPRSPHHVEVGRSVVPIRLTGGLPTRRYKHHGGVTSSVPAPPRRRIHGDLENRGQPDGRFLHLLVWLFNDEHVRVTFECHCRLMPQHVMDFLVEVGRIPAGPPVAATPVRIAESPLRKPKWPWVIQSQKRMIPTILRALRHPLTRRKVVRAVRRPLQLAVPVMSFRPRCQSQGWRTCHAISSSSN
ncbi:hypothetical protein PIB30_053585 [Stylosanthes scabra]|uniref:Uncharacterized protein n=1 Tax=Stylosanthes scabra TaxID=79078 RepID=A0ABU6VIQ3_9FABA|nr:hypothetical protein [Stylosanthes scabra]